MKKLIIHEKYSGRDPSNDIALLKLDRSIETSDKVSIVCLPSQGSRVSAGKQCYITVIRIHASNPVNPVYVSTIQFPKEDREIIHE